MNLPDLPNNVEVTNHILQMLVRTLIEKNVLSEEDVREFLLQAALRNNGADGSVSPEAAREIATGELIPAFFGQPR